jgi:hypothetical protein
VIVGIGMGSLLSCNEREALTRFISKLIVDVENVTALFESRGADSTSTRAAQANLQATLEYLQHDQEADEELEVCLPNGL